MPRYKSPDNDAEREILEARESGLVELDLYRRGLLRWPSALESFSALESLNLGANKLLTIPDGAFEGLTSLRELHLSFNRGLERLPASLFRLPNLRSLWLREVPLGVVPSEIIQLQGLRELSLCDTELTELPEELAALTNLEFLDISDNKVRRFPRWVWSLPKLANLQTSSNHWRSGI